MSDPSNAVLARLEALQASVDALREDVHRLLPPEPLARQVSPTEQLLGVPLEHFSPQAQEFIRRNGWAR